MWILLRIPTRLGLCGARSSSTGLVRLQKYAGNAHGRCDEGLPGDGHDRPANWHHLPARGLLLLAICRAGLRMFQREMKYERCAPQGDQRLRDIFEAVMRRLHACKDKKRCRGLQE